jgi:hypothetical protein
MPPGPIFLGLMPWKRDISVFWPANSAGIISTHTVKKDLMVIGLSFMDTI